MKIIDAHSHLDYISHKHQVCVEGTICCAKNESEWDSLVNISRTDRKTFPAFGIHPWFIDNVKDEFEIRLQNLLETNRNFMVGEIGLDKYKPNMDKQIEIFRKQVNIAIKLKRTIFLHCVGAWDKIFKLFKEYKKTELPIVVAHSFNGSEDILRYLQENYDMMFSFSEIDKIQDYSRIEQIDLNKILVETDAKSNIILKDVVDKISLIKNNTEAWNIIYNNTKRVLKNG